MRILFAGERKIKTSIVAEIVTLLMLGLFSTSAFAWVHNDGSEDLLYEQFGPRAGKLLCHLYADDTAEFNALKAGDIDITDCPLSKAVCEELKQWPHNETIQVVNYGPEFGLFILDLNSNNNQYLGNPPDPAYPNPVADRDPGTGNPMIGGGAGPANDYNPMSSVYMRRAIAYLIDRPGLIADPAIGTDFAYPMYTTVPPALTKYLLDTNGDPSMPWAWKYDPAAANATLEEGGFKINPATGYRYWDLDGDDIEDPDEYVELIFRLRHDHSGRRHIGSVLYQEIMSVNVRVYPHWMTYSIVYLDNKNFHMYIGGWKLGLDPDHLILWSWDYYWHPGFCYNYGGHNDPDFNAAAEGIMYANDQAEAVMYAMMAQEAQARQVLGIPLYCASGNKAYYKTNTGGNPGDSSEGEEWENSFVNTLGYGIDNGWTFMNMHTTDHQYFDGMVIDYGLKVPKIKWLNPVYASWLYDWKVLGMLYDSLLVRNASDLGQFTPWVAKNYELGTYTHPTLGLCTSVEFSLRSDIYWQDGTPLTVADVEFTFWELKNILASRGLPNPWWWSNVQDILSFSILDPYTFEVLLDVKSYWALGWIGSNIILPKHIWKPIATTGDLQTSLIEPHLIGSGKWRFDEYSDPGRYVRLVANTPGSIVHGITSPYGSFCYDKKVTNIHVEEPIESYCSHKIPPDRESTITFDLENRGAIQVLTVDEDVEIYEDEVLAFADYDNPTTDVPPHTQKEINRINDFVQYDVAYLVDNVTYLAPDVQKITWNIYLQNVEKLSASGNGWAYSKTYLPPGPRKDIKIIETWTVTTAPPSFPTGVVPPAHKQVVYATIPEDIAGSTLYDDIGFGDYPYKSQLPSPDTKVDIKDVALAAKGFGSYPGHPRWISVADINGDYKIDIKDIAAIAKMFGWLPS